MKIPCLLVIDPHLVKPETDAINTITRLCFIASQAARIPLVVQVMTPTTPQINLQKALKNLDVKAVISLGSAANVTESHEWFEDFEKAIRSYYYSLQLPFLGICFSHQFLAHMHGMKVDFLKKRRSVKFGRHDGSRIFNITHPKLRFLLNHIPDDVLGTENKLDNEYKEIILGTRTWSEEQWRKNFQYPDPHLTKFESRTKHFIENHTKEKVRFAIAHEQEVWQPHLPGFVHAGQSDVCDVEAFISNCGWGATFQAHPEYNVDLLDGKFLIRNFIYLALMSPQKCKGM